VRKADLDGKAPKYSRAKSRFQQRKGQWYFRTREGDRRGPFESRDAAELDLKLYIDAMQFVEENQTSLPTDVEWGDLVFVEVATPAYF
jgi:hypothetical protein